MEIKETSFKIRAVIEEQNDKFCYFVVSSELDDVGIEVQITTDKYEQPSLDYSVCAINRIALDVTKLIKNGKVKTRGTKFIDEAIKLIKGMYLPSIVDNWTKTGTLNIEYYHNAEKYVVTFKRLSIY